jgi:hypothetical protein
MVTSRYGRAPLIERYVITDCGGASMNDTA